jgi:glycosyltransferase involved in cell wall biosynthesis
LDRKLTSKKTLVLASSRTAPKAWEEIAAGRRPRLDYLELAVALNGDVLDTQAGEAQAPWRKRVEHLLSSDIRQAQVAWGRRGLYDTLLSTSEKVGIPLGLHRPKKPHILIAHNLNSVRKRQMQTLTGVLRWGVSDIICLSSSQEHFLLDEVGLAMERVHRMNHNVDTQFYRPESAEDGGYLLAVGRENRDYPTLVAAARVLGLPTVIVASSLWARRGGALETNDLPPNVTLSQEFVSYTALRDLYAGARLIVVPLNECGYAAGSTGLLEAMAMGKPTVVSQTTGLEDYLQDEHTHRSVPSGDPRALAEVIAALWHDLPARTKMGQAARRLVENEMSMERYVSGVAAVVRHALRETA